MGEVILRQYPLFLQVLCSQQSLFYVWEVKWAKDPPLCLQCVFSASFSPTAAEGSSYKPYHYEFQLENVSVSACLPLRPMNLGI